MIFSGFDGNNKWLHKACFLIIYNLEIKTIIQETKELKHNELLLSTLDRKQVCSLFFSATLG